MWCKSKLPRQNWKGYKGYVLIRKTNEKIFVFKTKCVHCKVGWTDINCPNYKYIFCIAIFCNVVFLLFLKRHEKKTFVLMFKFRYNVIPILSTFGPLSDFSELCAVTCSYFVYFMSKLDKHEYCSFEWCKHKMHTIF